MKRINVKDKLAELNYPVESLSLGDFDQIGEMTAKKMRNKTDPLYKSVGAFFRPNYERGILISALIKRYECKRVLEIGFGRGYASMCAAKAMNDMGWGDEAAVYSCDINFDEKHLNVLAQVFPREWFRHLNLIKGNVNDAVLNMGGPVDLVYIDGDHTYQGVKYDYDCVKDRYKKFILFDDYDPESKSDGMQVARLIDELDIDKELIISDRRIFVDCRAMKDEDVKYGQVLVKHPGFDAVEASGDW